MAIGGASMSDVPCTEAGELKQYLCENARKDVDPPPVVFHVMKLYEVTDGTRVWYLNTCIYTGHTGRWLPIIKRLGVHGPGDGCRVVKEFLPKDHPAYDQEMNPHTRVRVAV